MPEQGRDDSVAIHSCRCYPTLSQGWGHGGRPWSPRSQAIPHGVDQRLYRDRESPKSERHKKSVAGQCRMRGVLRRVSAGTAGSILDSANPKEIRA